MPATTILWPVIAAALLAAAAYWFSRRRQYQRTGRLLRILSKLGSQQGLSFTSQERLAGGIIGFDNLKKVLLVLKSTGTNYHWYIIRLEEVSFCRVLTTYHATPFPFPERYSFSESIDQVALQFHFKNGRPPASLPFYCRNHHKSQELPVRQTRVSSWHCFLQKLLRKTAGPDTLHLFNQQPF